MPSQETEPKNAPLSPQPQKPEANAKPTKDTEPLINNDLIQEIIQAQNESSVTLLGS